MRIGLFCTFFFLFIVGQLSGYGATPRLSKADIPRWVQSTPKQPKAPDDEDISAGYYFERVEYQVNIGDQSRFYRDVKVLTENAGAEYAGQVNITFNPQYQTLTLHELYVIRDGKPIDKLDISKFQLLATEGELSRFIYNGTYSAYLLLEDLRKDNTIVVSYSLKGFNPVFGNRFFDTQFLQGPEPVGLLYVNYIVPKGRTLRFKGFKEAPPATQQDLGNAMSYSWSIAGTGKVDYESDVPLWYATRQRIECSEFKSWAEVAQWAADVNPIPTLAVGSRLQHFADQLWSKANGNSTQYVKEATDFVQNEVRYMGVEVGEYSHRANNPEKVFDQRYGDCKDKSVLLSALLKYKGLGATLVLANSYEEYELPEYLPSPSAFNHMVVYAEVDGRGQYIDPTISNQGGHIRDRYFPFYGKVLWATKGGKLNDTEKIVSGNTRVEERFQLQKDGGATLDVLTIYTGANADNMRNYFKQTAKKQIETSYLEYYQRFYKQLSKRSALTYEDDVENNVFSTREYYTIKQAVDVDAATGRRHMGIYSATLSNYLPKVNDARTAPIALQYPLSIEHDVYVINPEGKPVPAMKEATFTDRESYYFGKTISTSKDTLKIAYRLGFHDTYVAGDKINEYLADFSDRESLFSNAVYFDENGFLWGSGGGGKFSLWAIFAFFGLLAILVWATIRYYHWRGASSLVPLYDEPDYDSIGGWLIVLLLLLIIIPINVFYTTMVESGFRESAWTIITIDSGVSPLIYRALLVFEFTCNTFVIFLSGYCIYLLIKRRDIFPQTFFCFLVIRVACMLIDLLLVWIFLKEPVTVLESLSALGGMSVYAVLWSLYIFNSTRVKGTFLVQSAISREQQHAGGVQQLEQ